MESDFSPRDSREQAGLTAWLTLGAFLETWVCCSCLNNVPVEQWIPEILGDDKHQKCKCLLLKQGSFIKAHSAEECAQPHRLLYCSENAQLLWDCVNAINTVKKMAEFLATEQLLCAAGNAEHPSLSLLIFLVPNGVTQMSSILAESVSSF